MDSDLEGFIDDTPIEGDVAAHEINRTIKVHPLPFICWYGPSWLAPVGSLPLRQEPLCEREVVPGRRPRHAGLLQGRPGQLPPQRPTSHFPLPLPTSPLQKEEKRSTKLGAMEDYQEFLREKEQEKKKARLK